MLLDPRDWSLAFRSDEVIAGLGSGLRDRMTQETHAAVMEVTTGVHRRVGDAVTELAELRCKLSHALARHGLRAGVAGMHPSALWERHDRLVAHARPPDRRVDAGARPARADPRHTRPRRDRSPRAAVRLLNRLRVHLPLLLGLSANSRSGRVGRRASRRRAPPSSTLSAHGLPRAFRDTPTGSGWSTRSCARGPSRTPPCCGGTPGCSRVTARSRSASWTPRRRSRTSAPSPPSSSRLRFEFERPDGAADEPPAGELIEANRFLAARDGMRPSFDAASGRRITAVDRLDAILAACRPWAGVLGCERELAAVRRLAARNGASRQVARAHEGDLRGVVARRPRPRRRGAD